MIGVHLTEYCPNETLGRKKLACLPSLREEMEVSMASNMENSVLVVDDERIVLELYEYFLSKAGIKAYCVNSGTDALHKIEEQSFACMITDLNMPEMDGFQLTVRVRELAPQMPIVLCTGDASPRTYFQAVELGIAMVCSKPVNFQKVMTILKSQVWKTETVAKGYEI